MKNLFTLVLCLFCSHIMAQADLFNKLYNLSVDTFVGEVPSYYWGQKGYGNDGMEFLEAIDSNEYLAIAQYDNLWASNTYNTLIRKGFMVKINSKGEIIDTFLFKSEPQLLIGDMKVNSNRSIAYVAGASRSTYSDTSQLSLTLFDCSTLDTLRTYHYAFKEAGISLTSYINPIELMNDSLILLGALIRRNGYEHSKILQWTPSGIIDTLTFQHNTNWRIRDITKYNQDSYFAVSELGNVYPNLESSIMLHKINIHTGLEWYKQIYFDIADEHEPIDLLLSKDNYLYITGYTKAPYPSKNYKIFLLKLDTNGVQQWVKFFDRSDELENEEAGKNLKEDAMGNIILVGSVINGTGTNLNPSTYNSFLMKLDPQGNILWERFPKRDTMIYENGNDVIHTVYVNEQNEFLMSGTGGFVALKSDPNPVVKRFSDGWLVKADSCGFVSNNYPKPYFEIDSIVGKTVYLVNKSDNYCTAWLKYGENSNDSLFMHAYSNPVPTYFSYTYQDTGTYTISLRALAGNEFKTYAQSISITANTSVNVNNLSHYSDIQLYPNPALNKLELVLGLSTAVSTAEIYSITGKIEDVKVFETNQQRHSIDISLLSNGVYYIHFYDNNKQKVGTKKFVVLKQ